MCSVFLSFLSFLSRCFFALILLALKKHPSLSNDAFNDKQIKALNANACGVVFDIEYCRYS